MQVPFVNDLFGVNITLNPIALAGALIAATGMLLVVSSVGMLGGIRIRIGDGTSLEAEGNRMDGITPYTGSFIERVLAPLIRQVMAHTSESERLWVEQAYDLLDRADKGSSDYYVKKVMCGMVGFGAGIALGLLAASEGLGLLLLILPLSFSVGGYFLPKLELQSDLRRRAESIFFEVPYVLDRLGVSLVSHNNDLVEGLNALLQRPEGGYLMRELLQVVEDNAKSGHIERALARMAERNRDISVVVRVAELLINSQRGAMNLNQSLQDVGDRSVDEVENRIRRRGEENSQAMIVPSLISLIGIMVVMLGPAWADLSTLMR